jgi:hypothetical protein
VRDLEVIASELRLIAVVRRTAADVGMPARHIGPVDELPGRHMAWRCSCGAVLYAPQPGAPCRDPRQRPLSRSEFDESDRLSLSDLPADKLRASIGVLRVLP